MRRLAPLLFIAMLACNGARPEQTGSIDSQPGPSRAPDVIFVPTRMHVVEQMLTLARVDSADMVYDLGSGDGRIVITAASRLGARGVGIDIDPQRIRESHVNADSARVRDRVEFRQADLFTTNLRSATAVTLYLLPSLNRKLIPKLYNELKPGTPVVSNSFDMGDWVPDSTVRVDERQVYLWIIPANAAGTWNVSWGDSGSTNAGRAEVKLYQAFQQLAGRASFAGGASDSIRVGQLRGDSITFSFRSNGAQIEFGGRVDGARMSGTTRGGAGALTWSASRRGPAGSPLPREKFR